MLSAITVLPVVRVFTIVAACVAVVEMLRPAQRGAGIRGRTENVGVLALNLAAFGFVVEQWPWLFSNLGRWGLLDVAVPARYHHTALGVAVTTLVYALVWDFFQYWAHRAEHEWRLLWPMHSVHHSDRCMNATTSGRSRDRRHVLRLRRDPHSDDLGRRTDVADRGRVHCAVQRLGIPQPRECPAAVRASDVRAVGSSASSHASRRR